MIFLQEGPLRHWLVSANLNVNTVNTLINVFIVASHIKQESRAITGRTVRSAVNVDTYRILQ